MQTLHVNIRMASCFTFSSTTICELEKVLQVIILLAAANNSD